MNDDELKLVIDEIVKALTAIDQNVRNLMTAVQNLTQVAVEHKQRIEKLEHNSYDEFH